VRLAKADARVDEQRVEAHGTGAGFGNRAGSGERHPVRRSSMKLANV